MGVLFPVVRCPHYLSTFEVYHAIFRDFPSIDPKEHEKATLLWVAFFVSVRQRKPSNSPNSICSSTRHTYPTTLSTSSASLWYPPCQ